MNTTSTPGRRRTCRQLLSACGLATVTFTVAVTAVVSPAAAAPEEGVATASPSECQPVGWGWPNGADEPAYFGQRFGVYLAPECRGPVLEGLDAGDQGDVREHPTREPQILEFDWRHAGDVESD